QKREKCQTDFQHHGWKTFENMNVHLNNTPSTITARIGPMDAKPIKPNFSPELSSSERNTEATPMPSARINGTAIGPVVTPPESKEMEMKASGTNKDSRKTKA